MVVGVAADEVTGSCDGPRSGRVGENPAALQEHRRANLRQRQGLNDLLRYADARRSVGMLDVEGQRDTQAAHLSTPVMTMPRVNARWKMMYTMTGMIKVISVPAWSSEGSRLWMPLKRCRPTASGCSSGCVVR